MRITIAAIGAFLILLAIYLFPFGQDFINIWLTQQTGSLVNAWLVMYVICFGLLFAGFFMGGAAYLGIRRLSGIFRMMLTNPIMFSALLIVMFLVYLKFTGVIT